MKQHITRSFSVPVNVKTQSLRRMDSSGGLIRVISINNRPTAAENASPDISPETEAGICLHSCFLLLGCKTNF